MPPPLAGEDQEVEMTPYLGDTQMAKVRLTTGDQQDWIVSGERQLDDAERGKLGQGELTSSYRVREPGDASSPQLVELRYEPGAVIQPHCHDEDEIIYVRSGAMVIGAR